MKCTATHFGSCLPGRIGALRLSFCRRRRDKKTYSHLSRWCRPLKSWEFDGGRISWWRLAAEALWVFSAFPGVYFGVAFHTCGFRLRLWLRLILVLASRLELTSAKVKAGWARFRPLMQ